MLRLDSQPSKKIVIEGDNTENITKSSGRVKVKWSNKGNILTSSGDIEIREDNYWGLITSSGDIEIGEDNNWNIKTSSGDIEISGINIRDILTSSGDIEIGEDNGGNLTTSSGNIEIGKNNGGNLTTNSGDIEIGKNNNWELITNSGDIEIRGINYWKLTTISGSIAIQDMKIRIERMNVSNITTNTSVSIWWILWWIKFGWWNIVSVNTGSNQSISIINGKVYIDGVEQVEWAGKGKSNKYLVHIDEITVDFDKKIVKEYTEEIDEIKKKELDLKIGKDTIKLVYRWQQITIYKDKLVVESMDEADLNSEDKEGGLDMDNLRQYIK